MPKSKTDKKLDELERLKRRKYRIEAAIDKKANKQLMTMMMILLSGTTS